MLLLQRQHELTKKMLNNLYTKSYPMGTRKAEGAEGLWCITSNGAGKSSGGELAAEGHGERS